MFFETLAIGTSLTYWKKTLWLLADNSTKMRTLFERMKEVSAMDRPCEGTSLSWEYWGRAKLITGTDSELRTEERVPTVSEMRRIFSVVSQKGEVSISTRSCYIAICERSGHIVIIKVFDSKHLLPCEIRDTYSKKKFFTSQMNVELPIAKNLLRIISIKLILFIYERNTYLTSFAWRFIFRIEARFHTQSYTWYIPHTVIYLIYSTHSHIPDIFHTQSYTWYIPHSHTGL